MNSFKELNSAIEAVYEAMDACKEGKSVYISKRDKTIKILDDSLKLINDCLHDTKREDNDGDDELKDKANRMAEAIKSTYSQLRTAGKTKAEMKYFTQKLLEIDFGNASKDFFKYRQFRNTKKLEYVEMKVNLATELAQLKKYLVLKGASDKTLASIDTFLNDLKGLNLYETSGDDVSRLMEEFKNATKYHLFSTGRSAKKGLETKYKKSLKATLQSAERYTTLSGRYWHRCHELKAIVQADGGYIKAMRKAVKARKFESDYSAKRGEIQEAINRLQQRIERYLSDKDSAKLLKKVKEPSGLEKIKDFGKVYNISSLNSIDFDSGSRIDQPEIEAVLPTFVIKTPECKAEIDIPGYEMGVVTGGIEIGAAVEASVGFGGKVKFTPLGDPILTSSLNAKGELKAEVYAGAFLQFVKIVKISARGVLGAALSLELSLNHELDKALLHSFDYFDLKGKSELKLEIEGHLEFVVGLTAPLKMILETCEIKAELKFQSPKLVILEAARNDELSLHIPIDHEPEGFERKSLEFKKGGEWKLDFVAKNRIADLIERKFGGLDKFNEVMQENPLSEDELEEISQEFSFMGSRA